MVLTHIVGEDGRPQATSHCVRRHAEGEKPKRGVNVHSSQRVDGGSATDQDGRHDQAVGGKTEEHVRKMGDFAVSNSDDLEEGLCVGCFSLGLLSMSLRLSRLTHDGQIGEDHDLGAVARGIEE